MSILAINVFNTGLVGEPVSPRRCTIVTTDSLATITTAGYLNNENSLGNVIHVNDVFDIIYSYNQATKSGTFGIFTVSYSVTTGFSLTLWENPGNVLLPVVSGDFAIFNGTTGQIKDAGFLPSNATKTNVVMLSSASTTATHIASFADTTGSVQDSAIATTALVLNNVVNTMAAGSEIILDKGIGTESANAVTINKQSGVITTTSLATAQYATETITLTNSLIATTSVVLVSIMGGTNTTTGITVRATAGSGTSTIILTNLNSAALNGTVIIGFSVF